MDQIQRRVSKAHRITLEQRSDGALPKIRGYASVFYREGDPATEFEIFPAEYGFPRVVERIMPTAFDRALREDDVRALFNHDAAAVLGRTGQAGTLRLWVDEIGLGYEIDPPDTQLARDLLQSLKRGDISGSSFAFLPRGTTTRDVREGDTTAVYLERTDVKLFDVGPVTYPAYGGASAYARNGDGLESLRSEIVARRKAADLDAVDVALSLMVDWEGE